MKKSSKIALYLLAAAVMLVALWRMVDMPRFTAEQAFRRVEQRETVPKCRVLGDWELPPYSRIGGGAYRGQWRRVLVAGVTDSYLHLTQVEHRGVRWNSREVLMSLPLEDCTFELLPWEMYSPGGREYVPGAFLYTRRQYACLDWRLTVGDRVCVGRVEPRAEDGAFVLIPFSDLSGSDSWAWRDQLEYRTYHWRSIGFDKSRMTMDVKLELELLDEQGTVLERLEREYPKDSSG